MIPKNSIIFQEDAYACVVDASHLDKYCDHCFNCTMVKKCSSCKYVGYCNINCQQLAWPVHRKECKSILKFSGKLTDHIRLTARIIRKLNKNIDREKFFNLDANIDYFLASKERMDAFNEYYPLICDFVGKKCVPDFNEMLQIESRICTNAFKISFINDTQVGTAIYLFPKSFRHSCIPNVTHAYFGSTVIVTTLENLPEINWNKLKISLVDFTEEDQVRKQMLKDQALECHCDKCVNPPRYLLCSNEFCLAACAVEEAKCHICDQKLSAEHKALYFEAMKFVHSNRHNLMDKKTQWQRLCLKKMRGVIHPGYSIYIKLAENICFLELRKKNWINGVNLLKTLLISYETHFSYYTVAIASIYYKMAKIQLKINDEEEFQKTMENLMDICFVVYGEQFGYEIYDLMEDDIINSVAHI